MGYVEQNLMAEEKVTYQAKLHWVVFLWPAIFLFIAIVYGLAGLIFLFLAVLTGINAFIFYSTSEFVVTNKRVLVKVGWIRRRSLELLLTKVEGIGVNQGILGRMLDYGTILVTGTGGTKEPFSNIAAPFEFRKRVQEQIASVEESKYKKK